MGLDITTKEGYARFNWSSAGAFQGWCEKHLHKNPFFQWSGFNGDEVQLKGEALTEAKEWMVALEKYCARIGDNILNFSESELIGEVASRMYALGKKEAGLKERCIKTHKFSGTIYKLSSGIS